jgi:hypothetical protein
MDHDGSKVPRSGAPVSSWLPCGPFNVHREWSPKEYRHVTQRPHFVYLRLLGSTLGGGNVRTEKLATEENQ